MSARESRPGATYGPVTRDGLQTLVQRERGGYYSVMAVHIDYVGEVSGVAHVESWVVANARRWALRDARRRLAADA